MPHLHIFTYIVITIHTIFPSTHVSLELLEIACLSHEQEKPEADPLCYHVHLHPEGG